MIHEYAIEPEAVVEWASDRLACRYIKDNFGIGQPRIMAEFPKLKNWRKQFKRAAASLDDLALERSVELFKLLKEKTVLRSGSEYDGNISWLENTEKENQRHLFKAILAKNNPNRNKNILPCDQIGEWSDNLWKEHTRMVINRETGAMRKALAPLLQKANEIVFVDPYFRASQSKFREPFITMLEESALCSVYPSKERIELHVSDDYHNSPSCDEFRRECDRWLPGNIPHGITVQIKRWKQRPGHDKLHNRYILTNLGGVAFGIGLDTGQKGEMDDLSLLGRDQWALRWQQYVNNDGEFEVESEFTIEGENNQGSKKLFAPISTIPE
jgi:hypothetical protein